MKNKAATTILILFLFLCLLTSCKKTELKSITISDFRLQNGKPDFGKVSTQISEHLNTVFPNSKQVGISIKSKHGLSTSLDNTKIVFVYISDSTKNFLNTSKVSILAVLTVETGNVDFLENKVSEYVTDGPDISSENLNINSIVEIALEKISSLDVSPNNPITLAYLENYWRVDCLPFEDSFEYTCSFGIEGESHEIMYELPIVN